MKNQYFTKVLWLRLRLKFMVINVAISDSLLQQMCFIYTGNNMSRREYAQAGIPLPWNYHLAKLTVIALVVAPA